MAGQVTPQPKDRKTIKEADMTYRRSQKHVLEQCTPGGAFELPDENDPLRIVFQAMHAEGYLQCIQGGRYVITAKGQARRNALRRWSCYQWMLENASWLVPTFVALCSTIVALCALFANSG